jgi:hypothetical protein
LCVSSILIFENVLTTSNRSGFSLALELIGNDSGINKIHTPAVIPKPIIKQRGTEKPYSEANTPLRIGLIILGATIAACVIENADFRSSTRNLVASETYEYAAITKTRYNPEQPDMRLVIIIIAWNDWGCEISMKSNTVAYNVNPKTGINNAILRPNLSDKDAYYPENINAGILCAKVVQIPRRLKNDNE